MKIFSRIKFLTVLLSFFLSLGIVSCKTEVSGGEPEPEPEPQPQPDPTPDPGPQPDPDPVIDTRAFAGTPFTEDGDIVYFGDFPQTLKADSVTINKKKTTQAGDYTCYLGSDNAWYVKCEDKSGYPVTEKYYKIEPLKWKLVDDNYVYSSGFTGKLYLCQNQVIACQFFDQVDVNRKYRTGFWTTTAKPNNWLKSRLFAYLNGTSYPKIEKTDEAETQYDDETFTDKGFLNTAFTTELLENVLTSSNGIMFCLSRGEAIKYFAEKGNYGEYDPIYADGYKMEPTDFAKATAPLLPYHETDFDPGIWLRSASRTDLPDSADCFNYGTARVDGCQIVTHERAGVVPAFVMPKEHSVIISSETVNGTVTSDVQKALPGEKVYLTPEADEGWAFKSIRVYYLNGTYKSDLTLETTDDGRYCFTMPSADVTVEAVFKQLYRVVVSPDIKHGTVTANFGWVDGNILRKVYVITSPEEGWSKDETPVRPDYYVTLTPDDGFVLTDYTIKVGSSTYTKEQFERYSVSYYRDKNFNACFFEMSGSDVEITATFKWGYHITALPEMEHGTIIAEPPLQAFGQKVKISAVADEGYKFVSGSMKVFNSDAEELELSGKSANATFTMPEGNVTVTASFIKLYKITIDENITGGTIKIGYTSQSAGEDVFVEFIPDEEYYFRGNENDLIVTDSDGNVSGRHLYNGSTKFSFIMPASDVTVSAKFFEKCYVRYEDGVEDKEIELPSVTPLYGNSRDYFNYNSEIALNFKDVGNRDGYVFTGWHDGTKFYSKYDSTYNHKIKCVEKQTVLTAQWAKLVDFTYEPTQQTLINPSGSWVEFMKFGDYPQTLKADDVTVDMQSVAYMGNFECYPGSDGNWYVNGYNYKWYKIEPIEWVILDGTKVSDKERFIIARYPLESHCFDSNNSNYKDSEVRKFLNEDFINRAFTQEMQEKILTTTVDNSLKSLYENDSLVDESNTSWCEDTQDKIFLLSVRETKKYGRLSELYVKDYEHLFACYLYDYRILRSPGSESKMVQCFYITHSTSSIFLSSRGKDGVGINGSALHPALRISGSE